MRGSQWQLRNKLYGSYECNLRSKSLCSGLDYLFWCLTILGTILVSRKSWTGLLISIVNCVIVCIIGFRASQFGFIPSNLICICLYAFNIRSWVKKTHTHRIRQAMGVETTATRWSTLPTLRPSRSECLCESKRLSDHCS